MEHYMPFISIIHLQIENKNIMKRRKAVLQAADLVTLISYGFEFVVI